MNAGRDRQPSSPSLAAAPDREIAPTERIGRLDRLPGMGPLPPPVLPASAHAITAPSHRMRRTTRETIPLYPQVFPTDDE